MIQDKSVNQDQGFSLLEIVTVLVLLGVIASILAPRYFDMQQQAEQKAAEAALAEVQVRINTKFSREIQNGVECSEAQKKVNQLKNLDPNEKIGNGYRFNHHIIAGGEIPPSSEQKDVWKSTITREGGGYSFENLAQLRVPVCLDWTETEETNQCHIFGTDYSCFDLNTPCQHWDESEQKMKDGGDWKTGSVVNTSDGIYIVISDESCYLYEEGGNIGYKFIENPKNYPNFLMKPNVNRQRFWTSRTVRVCNEENVCWDDTRNRWDVKDGSDVLKYGDWYSDGVNSFVFVYAGEDEWTATSEPPVKTDDYRSGNWVMVHSWKVITP